MLIKLEPCAFKNQIKSFPIFRRKGFHFTVEMFSNLPKLGIFGFLVMKSRLSNNKCHRNLNVCHLFSANTGDDSDHSPARASDSDEDYSGVFLPDNRLANLHTKLRPGIRYIHPAPVECPAPLRLVAHGNTSGNFVNV